MSYYSLPEIREQRYGSVIIYREFCGGWFESEITMHYFYHEWSEGHPCGDTYAYERLTEIGDEEYELDGESLNYDELVERIGQKETDQAIERILQDG